MLHVELVEQFWCCITITNRYMRRKINKKMIWSKNEKLLLECKLWLQEHNNNNKSFNKIYTSMGKDSLKIDGASSFQIANTKHYLTEWLKSWTSLDKLKNITIRILHKGNNRLSTFNRTRLSSDNTTLGRSGVGPLWISSKT